MDIVVVSKVIIVALLGISGFVGLLALLSPSALATVASYGNQVIYRGAPTRANRHWNTIDKFAIAHSRLFGLFVFGTLGYLWSIFRHGPEAYSKSVLLVIVAIALNMGVLTLYHIRRQSQEIKKHRAHANVDPLTGVANRRVFETELARRLAQRQRQGTPLCLLILDIDNFKTFNDNFGHLLGDEILKKVANVVDATAREMDVVARLGGDEFVVLLPGTELDAASQAAERLRSEIGDSPVSYEGHDHSLTVSIGLTEAQLDDDAVSLLKRSDSALYAAKDAGRNCCFRHPGPEPAVVAPCEQSS